MATQWDIKEKIQAKQVARVGEHGISRGIEKYVEIPGVN